LIGSYLNLQLRNSDNQHLLSMCNRCEFSKRERERFSQTLVIEAVLCSCLLGAFSELCHLIG
jgi:hypothetical protein